MSDWTTQDLAKAAKVSDARIRQLLLSGELKGYKRVGAWFVSDEEAKKFLETREAESEASEEK